MYSVQGLQASQYKWIEGCCTVHLSRRFDAVLDVLDITEVEG